MKSILTLLRGTFIVMLLTVIASSAFATTYYSKSGASVANDRTSWTTSSTGSGGSSPSAAQFTASTHSFIIRSGQTLTSNATAWTLASPITVNGILVLSGTGTKTFSSSVTVNSGGTLTISTTAQSVNIKGDLTVASGATFNHNQNYNSGSIILELEGDLDIDGTYSYGSNTPAIWMDGTASNSINTGSTALYKLLLQTGNFSASGNVTVNDEFYAMWNMTGGSFSTNGNAVVANWGIVNNGGTINVNGGSLTVNGAIGGMLIGRTNTFNGTLNVSSGTLTTPGIYLGTTTVTPKGYLIQTGGTINSGILDIGNTCSFTASGGTLNTTGDMNLGYSSSAFTNLVASSTVNIGGSLNNNGAITSAIPANPVITITGNLNNYATGSITNILGTWPAITVNGTMTNAGTFTTVGVTTVNVKGNWMNNGSSTAVGGTVTFNGTSNQTIGGSAITTFNNVIISPSAGVTVTPQTNNINILSDLTVSSGTFDLATYTANRTLTGGTFAVSANATVKLSGASGGRGNSNFPNNFFSNSLNASSTIEYSGGNGISQDIYSGVTYGNLVLSNSTGSGSSAKSLIANITGIAGNLTVNNNAVLNLSTYTANRTTAGGTLTLNGNAAMYVNGASGGQSGSNYPSNFGNSLGSASTVYYNSLNAVNQTIFGSVTYGNLSLSNGTGSGATTKSLSSNITGIAGNLSIGTATTFDMLGYTANGSSGTVNLSGGALMKLSGTTGGQTGSNFSSGFSTYTFDAASTVEYYGTAAQTIYALPSSGYGNLTLSSASVKTAGGAITARGNLLVNAGTFAGSSYNHSVAGNWTNNGTFTAGTSTVTFNSTATGKTIGGNISGTSAFNNITFNGVGGGWSFAGAVAAAGNFTITNGSVTAPSAGMTVGADWTNDALFTAGTGTVTLNGSAAAQIKGTAATNQFYNLVVNKSTASATVNLKRNIVIASDLTITTGIYDQETYTSNRAASGGTFMLTAAAKHRLSGNSGGACTSNNFPSDFTTLAFDVASTTEYYGSGQTVCSAPVYGHLTLSGSGTKTASSGTIKIKGDFTNTSPSVFAHGSGTISMEGTANQNFAGVAYYNLLLSNGATKTLSGAGSVEKELAVTGSTTVSLSSSNLTMRSTSAGTANIAAIPSGASFTYGTGRFVVERYINTGTSAGQHAKSWQLVATPAYGQSIYDAWQEAGSTAANYGTWVTGPGTGVDAYSAGPSVKYYDAATDYYIGVANTSSAIANVNGYFLYVRGDRTVTGTGTAKPTTLRMTGKIYQPTDAPAAVTVTKGKYQSAGNPYASAIDINYLKTNGAFSNLNYDVIVWDPSVGGTYGFGVWQTLSSANNYEPTIGSSISTVLYPAGVSSPNIQSGQAFFVHSANGATVNGSLSFTENAKVTTSRVVTRGSGDASDRYFFRAGLYTNTGDIADGNAVAFDDDFENTVDADDALKIPNSGENFGLLRSGNNLSVEARAPVNANDTIFYIMSNLRQQAYQLKFAPKNMPMATTAFLIDRFLNTTTPVSISDSSIIDFTVTSATASSAAGRFYVVFKTATVLPVTITSISAERISNQSVDVKWKVENELNIRGYIVERSGDGRSFSALSNSIASGLATYIYNDSRPLATDNYYRIRITGNDGKITYSSVVKVAAKVSGSSVSVYPNPVEGKTAQVIFTNQPAGIYNLQFSNSAGQVIWSGKVKVSGANVVIPVTLPSSMAAGVYQLSITTEGGKITNTQVIIL